MLCWGVSAPPGFFTTFKFVWLKACWSATTDQHKTAWKFRLVLSAGKSAKEKECNLETRFV